jgi:hypothetical protein
MQEHEMEIEFCGNRTKGNPSGGLCDEYRVSEIADGDDLLAAYRQIASAHPSHKPLFSLDDFSQACYTSGHACDSFDLDDTAGWPASRLPAELFEEGMYVGEFSTKAEFPLRARNFAKLVSGATFEDACRHGLTLDADGVDEWLASQEDVVSLLDQPLSALVVPAELACDALAALPNGYFTSDLNPRLNAAVARHFSQAHGYELMGVGASYLGFLRETPPGETAAHAIATDFCALYNVSEEGRPAFIHIVTQAIANRPWLWLRYTE